MKLNFLFVLLLIPSLIFGQKESSKEGTKDDEYSASKDYLSSEYTGDLSEVKTLVTSTVPLAGIRPNFATGLVNFETRIGSSNADLHQGFMGIHPEGTAYTDGISFFFKNSQCVKYIAQATVGNGGTNVVKTYAQEDTDPPFVNGGVNAFPNDHNPLLSTSEGLMYWQAPGMNTKNLVFKWNTNNYQQAVYQLHFDSKSSSGWNVQYDPSTEIVEFVIEGELYDQGLQDYDYTFIFTRDQVNAPSIKLNTDDDAGAFSAAIKISDLDLEPFVSGSKWKEFPSIIIQGSGFPNLYPNENADFIRIDKMYMRVVPIPPSCVGADYTPASGDDRAYFSLTNHNVATDYPELSSLDSTLNPVHSDLFASDLLPTSINCEWSTGGTLENAAGWWGSSCFDDVAPFRIGGEMSFFYMNSESHAGMTWEEMINTHKRILPIEYEHYAEYQKAIMYQPFAELDPAYSDFGLDSFYLPGINSFHFRPVATDCFTESNYPSNSDISAINNLFGTNYTHYLEGYSIQEYKQYMSDLSSHWKDVFELNLCLDDIENYEVTVLGKSLKNNKNGRLSIVVNFGFGYEAVLIVEESLNSSQWNDVSTYSHNGTLYDIVTDPTSDIYLNIPEGGMIESTVTYEVYYHALGENPKNGILVHANQYPVYIYKWVNNQNHNVIQIDVPFDPSFKDKPTHIDPINVVGNLNYIARKGDYFNIPVNSIGYNTNQYIPKAWRAQGFKKDINGNHKVKMMRGSLDLDYGVDPATGVLFSNTIYYPSLNFFWWSSFDFTEGCELKEVKLPE